MQTARSPHGAPNRQTAGWQTAFATHAAYLSFLTSLGGGGDRWLGWERDVVGFVVAGLTGRSCDPLVETPVKEPTTWGGGTACRPRENARRTSAAAPAAAGRQSQPDSNRRSRREATTHARTCASRWQREGRGDLLLIRNGHDHLFIALRTYLAAPATIPVPCCRCLLLGLL